MEEEKVPTIASLLKNGEENSEKSINRNKLFKSISSFYCIFLSYDYHLGCGYGALMNFMRSGSMFMITFFAISEFYIYYNHCDTNLMKKNL